MLVLSRKQTESIRIGDDIEVVVLRIASNRVRLGFRCPSDVPITRGEIMHFSEIDVPSDEVREFLPTAARPLVSAS